MGLYDNIFNNLLETGKLDLKECSELSYKEIDALTDTIRFWCTYGSGKLDKLGEEKKRYK
jgi:hypothetical protein